MSTKLNNWANEINSDWTSNYKAVVTEKDLTVLVLTYTESNQEDWIEVGGITSDFTVWATDEDVEDSLNYLVTR